VISVRRSERFFIESIEKIGAIAVRLAKRALLAL
jgi:hypothetical protein